MYGVLRELSGQVGQPGRRGRGGRRAKPRHLRGLSARGLQRLGRGRHAPGGGPEFWAPLRASGALRPGSLPTSPGARESWQSPPSLVPRTGVGDVAGVSPAQRFRGKTGARLGGAVQVRFLPAPPAALQLEPVRAPRARGN